MQLRQSIEGVMDILSEANVDQHLSDIIEAYLLAQGRRMMKDCIPVGVYIVMLCPWTDHILARNPLLKVEADLS